MKRRMIGAVSIACTVAALGAWKAAPRQDPVLDAMDAMIQEEYHTAAEYERIARDHAGAQPYAEWAQTERAHAELIGWLYRDRGKTAPPSRWSVDAVPTRRPLPQACAAALAAEERAIRLYDGYLGGELPSDVRRAFRHNRNVSSLQHVPVLRECTLRGTPGR